MDLEKDVHNDQFHQIYQIIGSPKGVVPKARLKAIKAPADIFWSLRMLNKMQRFGLRHSDLPSMLQNVSFFLKLLTLNIDKRNNKPIPVFIYAFAAMMFGCYFYVYLFSVIWFVFVRCAQTGDLVAAVIVFSLGIASEIGICKLIYMFIHLESIRDLVEGYLVCDAQVVPESRFHKNLLKSLRNVKRRALVFWCVIIGNGIAYIAKPILLPGRHFMEDSHIIYGLEPMYESPNYEIALTMNIAGVCVCCYLPANITAFFIVLAGYTESQILALSEELTSIHKDAKQFRRESINDTNADEDDQILDEFITRRLKDIIKRHTINLNLLRKIDHLFRGAIAIEFMILIIALIAELLAGLENTYMEVPFALIQVAMDCLNGQRLLDAGVEFEKAVYGCKWENFRHNNMRTVLLMLQTSQRPLTLSAGGITILSFSCLKSVFRSIYSAYTTLRTTMN